MPLLPITVNAGVADGIVRNNDGTATWTQKGISVHFAPSVSDIGKFATDALASFSTTNIQVRDDGTLRLYGGGRQYWGRPRFESEPSLSGGSGFQWNAQIKRLTYTDAGGKAQVIDPVLVYTSQVEQTVVGLGTGWTMNIEVDGTLRISGPEGKIIKLLPDYEVKFNGTTGMPVSSAWSAQDGKVYYLYNSAIVPISQGFTLE